MYNYFSFRKYNHFFSQQIFMLRTMTATIDIVENNIEKKKHYKVI